jgi:hypothetical protein
MDNAPIFEEADQFDQGRIQDWLTSTVRATATSSTWRMTACTCILTRRAIVGALSDPLEQFPLPTLFPRLLPRICWVMARLVWPGLTASHCPGQTAPLCGPHGGQKPHLLAKVTNGLVAGPAFSMPRQPSFTWQTKPRANPDNSPTVPDSRVERVETFDHIGRSRLSLVRLPSWILRRSGTRVLRFRHGRTI